MVLGAIDTALIQKRKPKVIVDAGNGAASVIMPYVLREAGCTVVGVNCDVSGMISRPLEPNAKNLEQTSEIIRSSNADMAIAHDGDADRAVILDEKGELLGLDTQLVLMCNDILRAGKGPMATTVEASLSIREAIEQGGGKPIITSVGSLNIVQSIKEHKGIFGGEPCGEYIFPQNHLVPDGIMTGLKFVEIFCRIGSLRSAAEGITKYPIMRAKYPCKDKTKAMELITESVKSFGGTQNTEDGVRVDFEDGWVLIRPSGTEPVMRITCEHKNKEELQALFSKAEKIVKSSG